MERSAAGWPQDLRKEIVAMLGDAYEDPRPLVDKELERATHLYKVRADDGGLRAFFCVAQTSFAGPSGLLKHAVYMGLSGGSRAVRGTAPTLRLYRRFLQDLARRPESPLLFATTASPLILGIMRRLFTVVHPGPCTDPTDLHRHWLREARSYLGYQGDAVNPVNPHCLPGVAAGVRYTAEERRRQRVGSDGDVVRQGWAVCEESGDRLLLLLEP